MWLVDGQIQLK